MNLEDVMLSEISQSQKTDTCCRFHLPEVPRVVKFIEPESSMVVARGWQYRVSVGENEKVLEMDGGDSCTIVEC